MTSRHQLLPASRVRYTNKTGQIGSLEASNHSYLPHLPRQMAQNKGGEADSYYNQESGGQSNRQYAPAPPMQYPPQAANNGYQGDSNPKYQQPPPNYGQNFQNPGAPPMAAGDGKQTFDQVFKLGTLVRLDTKYVFAAEGGFL